MNEITLVEELVEETRGLLSEARLARLRANRNMGVMKENRVWPAEYSSAAEFRKKEVPEDCSFCFGKVDNIRRSFGNMKATCSESCRKKVLEISKSITKDRITCGKCGGHKGNRRASTGMCRTCFLSYKRGNFSKEKAFQRKIADHLRTKLYISLKRAGSGRGKRTDEYLGCSFEAFKEHIESQFTEGMSWDNWSLYGWHIDHIRPVSSFDLTNEEERHLCFHYTNMRPLWAKDNLKKSNKILA